MSKCRLKPLASFRGLSEKQELHTTVGRYPLSPETSLAPKTLFFGAGLGIEVQKVETVEMHVQGQWARASRSHLEYLL